MSVCGFLLTGGGICSRQMTKKELQKELKRREREEMRRVSRFARMAFVATHCDLVFHLV